MCIAPAAKKAEEDLQKVMKEDPKHKGDMERVMGLVRQIAAAPAAKRGPLVRELRKMVKTTKKDFGGSLPKKLKGSPVLKQLRKYVGDLEK